MRLRRRHWFATFHCASANSRRSAQDQRPQTGASAGNSFPAPPICLQNSGRFPRIREIYGRLGAGVESVSNQPVSTKIARSQEVSDFRVIRCNSRRLHHSTRELRRLARGRPLDSRAQRATSSGVPSERRIQASRGAPPVPLLPRPISFTRITPASKSARSAAVGYRLI